jgi:uncharacterized protein (DUF362 family)/NAD-dependent dihydropyrimidine dehydrogenase PreA subunit
MSSKVVILEIKDYNVIEIKNKIRSCLNKHFPIETYFNPSDKILLKPNLLMAADPSQAIVTHPAVIEAVGGIFTEKGFKVSLGDSPGGFNGQKEMSLVYKESGYADFPEKNNIELLYTDKNIMTEGLPLCWWADGRYKLINMPKLKTHELMILTLAVKNLYGCIYGMHKSKLHVDYPRPKDFVNILFKLNQLINPSLNIVDGILAMEGEGPAKKGTPKKLNIIVIGNSALHTDLVISRMIGLSDQFNPLIKAALERGLIDEASLEIIDERSNKNIADFRLPGPTKIDNIPKSILNILGSLVKFQPKINFKKCTGCGQCAKICPKETISIINLKAVINYRNCISCLCCAEMCKFAAIDLKKSFLIRLAGAIGKLFSSNKGKK